MPTAMLRRIVVPAQPGSGTGVLRGTWMFDFEAGVESTNMREVDAWWEQKTATERAMVPLNGAAMCGMGIVDYDGISYDDFQRLPLSASPITANATGTNLLPSGGTFVVRTRHGKFVKVKVLGYDYNLEIHWETCTRPIHYLDVKIVLGSTPPSLVTRYVVECTYPAPGGSKLCGKGEFGPEGGILQGKVSDETGAFPPSVAVTVMLDFTPESGAAAITKTFTPPVTSTGANLLFEPYQIIQKTDLFLDLHPTVREGDFCLVKWKHGTTDDRVAASGQILMSTDDLRKGPPPTCEIAFVPDPASPKDLSFTIEGQFQSQPLKSFTKTVDLSEKAILIRARKSGAGDSYELAVD
jgi:hypothetical protein